MADYAKIEEGLVIDLIVISDDDTLDANGVASEEVGSQFCTDLLGGTWLQSEPIKHINEANIGGVYDSVKDAFYVTKPFPSWVMIDETCQWEAPIAYPDGLLEGEVYLWDEDTLTWLLQ
jgi:hypothetical protein